MNSYSVVDPATLEIIGEAPLQSAADVSAATQTAQGAGLEWAKDRAVRSSAMQAAAAELRENLPGLGEILTLEQGKPLSDAMNEFRVAADMLDYYATLEWEESIRLPNRDGKRVTVHNLPVGVVGTITPWNFPVSLLSVKVAPALAAGCTVVSRPSETTPLSTIAFAEVLNRHLPTGVFQTITGTGRDISVALSEDPRVRKISFTGSTSVGIAISQQAATTMKRVTMELGGNDPAILLDDINIEAAARGIVTSAFRNAGQVCMAVKRVYAPEHLAQEVAEAIAEAAAQLTPGHGLAPDTTIGPMHNAAQRSLVQDLVDHALSDGGQLVRGSRPWDCNLPGYFLQPTVVLAHNGNTTLVSEEQFGAALPVVAYSDLDELISSLNREDLGLGASVWCNDQDRAELVGQRLHSGTVWINQHTVVEPDAPFGGWRMSGVGRERGPWGLEPYLEQRTLNSRALVL